MLFLSRVRWSKVAFFLGQPGKQDLACCFGHLNYRDKVGVRKRGTSYYSGRIDLTNETDISRVIESGPYRAYTRTVTSSGRYLPYMSFFFDEQMQLSIEFASLVSFAHYFTRVSAYDCSAKNFQLLSKEGRRRKVKYCRSVRA